LVVRRVLVVFAALAVFAVLAAFGAFVVFAVAVIPTGDSFLSLREAVSNDDGQEPGMTTKLN
jgi:hypothetical protein